MDVRVSFMGVIANVAREKETTLSFGQTPTLRGLIDALEQRYGPAFGARVYRNSSNPRLLQMCTRIFVNTRLVDDRSLDQPLPLPADARPSTEILVYILPAACGG
ncbi:MAG TPA: MoaD/ThiS family protein [Burkholderiaceae bacterium]|nr:MoaD/ThiS family protein [Burkholderiaceae bacterium]